MDQTLSFQEGKSCPRLLLLTLVFLVPCVLPRANEITAEYDTSVAGQLVPVEETSIEVIEEDLDIRFEVVEPGLIADTGTTSFFPLRAHVTARYRIHNPSAEDRKPLIAFPILRSWPEEKLERIRLRLWLVGNQELPDTLRRGVRASILVNGQEIPSDYVSFESLFEKERSRWAGGVREWLEAWPEIAKAAEPEELPLDRAQGSSLITSFYSGANAFDIPLPPGDMDENTKRLFHVVSQQHLIHRRIDEWDLDALSFLYAATHPGGEDGVARFQETWGVEPSFLRPLSGEKVRIDPLKGSHMGHYALSRLNRRVDFLQYRPDLPAGKETIIEVRYSHLVDVDMYGASDSGVHQPYTCQFQYILRTSPKWRSFGPIRMSVAIPCNVAYAISLPMDYEGEKEGYDHFRCEVEGSKVRENLLIAQSEIQRWNRTGVVDFLPGDPYPKRMGFRESWEQYTSDPAGPFADDLLYRMAQQALRTSQDVSFLIRELDVPEDRSRPHSREVALAGALMLKIPERYPRRHLDGMLMEALYGMEGGLDYSRVANLRSRLLFVKRREREIRLRPEAGMSMREWNAKKERLKDAILMSEMEALNTFVGLCEQYLAGCEQDGDPNAETTPAARLKASVAGVELEKRLERLPGLDLRLGDELRYDLALFLKYWAIYDVYRDEPDAVEILRLLAWVCSHPSFAVSSSLTNLQRRQCEDVAKRVNEEVEARAIEVPKWTKQEGFPPWLGVNRGPGGSPRI